MINEATVFLDTSFAIALSSPTDRFHQKAIELARFIQQNSISLLTTRGITLEIGNALSKKKYRMASISLLHSLEQDSTIQIVSLSEQLYRHALQLY